MKLTLTCNKHFQENGGMQIQKQS